jgi:hypothetical protein
MVTAGGPSGIAQMKVLLAACLLLPGRSWCSPPGGAPGACRCTARQGGVTPLASSSYSYPILGAFWTIFIIFLWVMWFWILITVFIDIFRSKDLSGWAKALWFIFVLFIPLIGVLVYLIARGGKMHERSVRDQQQADREFRGYVQEAASGAPRRTSWPSWPTCVTGVSSPLRSLTARRPRSWPDGRQDAASVSSTAHADAPASLVTRAATDPRKHLVLGLGCAGHFG